MEGQTEQVLVRDVIEPHLSATGCLVTTSILKTKRPAAGPSHQGGVTSWAKLKREIRLLLGDTSLELLTTLIDYYGCPADMPGMATRPAGDPYRAVEHVERVLAQEIGDPRFVPHLTLHESETWVFAAAEQLGELYADADLASRLLADVSAAGGAELVNDGPATAPSKRLLAYRPDYVKTQDGLLAIADLGLPALRDKCPQLDCWLADLFGRSRA